MTKPVVSGVPTSEAFSVSIVLKQPGTDGIFFVQTQPTAVPRMHLGDESGWRPSDPDILILAGEWGGIRMTSEECEPCA